MARHHIRTASNMEDQEGLKTNSIPNMEDQVDQTLSSLLTEEPPMTNNRHSVDFSINTLLHPAATPHQEASQHTAHQVHNIMHHLLQIPTQENIHNHQETSHSQAIMVLSTMRSIPVGFMAILNNNHKTKVLTLHHLHTAALVVLLVVVKAMALRVEVIMDSKASNNTTISAERVAL